MKKRINLFYCREKHGGGTTSFAIHLYVAFKMAGVPVRMIQFDEKGFVGEKPFAKYRGVTSTFVNQGMAEDILENEIGLFVAPDYGKNTTRLGIDLSRLFQRDMAMVVHDPNEFRKMYGHLKFASIVKTKICIRPTMQAFFPEATFIHHPYVRNFDGHQGEDHVLRCRAASLARITSVKRPEIILEANRRLDPCDHIKFHGEENRQFTHFALKKGGYEEFKQGGHNLPLEWGVSAKAIREYQFMVDMTKMPEGDGGGSQYTFLEAWDAGSVVVVHKDWLRPGGEMVHGFNCVSVSGPSELSELMRDNGRRYDTEAIALQGTATLESLHDPVRAAEQYYFLLTGEIL